MSSSTTSFLEKSHETGDPDDGQTQKSLVTELNDKPEKTEKRNIHVEGDIKILKTV